MDLTTQDSVSQICGLEKQQSARVETLRPFMRSDALGQLSLGANTPAPNHRWQARRCTARALRPITDGATAPEPGDERARDKSQLFLSSPQHTECTKFGIPHASRKLRKIGTEFQASASLLASPNHYRCMRSTAVRRTCLGDKISRSHGVEAVLEGGLLYTEISPGDCLLELIFSADWRDGPS